MKTLFFILLFLSIRTYGMAQSIEGRKLDSLLSLYSPQRNDTAQVWILLGLADYYGRKNPDSSIFFDNKALQLSQHLGYERGEVFARRGLAESTWAIGDFVSSVRLATEVLNYFQTKKDSVNVHGWLAFVATAFRDQGDYVEAMKYERQAYRMYKYPSSWDSTMIGSIFFEMKLYDSAFTYLRQVERSGGTRGWSWLMLAKIYSQRGDDSAALVNYRKCIDRLKASKNYKDLAGAYNGLAYLYKKAGLADSSLRYSMQGLQIAQEGRFLKEALQSYLILSDIYSKTNPQVAYGYLNMALRAKDTLYNQEKQRQILIYQFNEQQRQQKEQQKQREVEDKVKLYSSLAALAVIAIIAVILFRNNRHKQRAYILLQKQKHEINVQKVKVEKALEELKTTQTQLIQQEKMASLGELTAGIAHEIQNPLNFVNNFSEVSNEMIDEMKNEWSKGNGQEAVAIANDVKQNLEKILHHGKRADAIVKGMLQHSRTSSGQKEPTDINALADEYLRLAYHGLRAKDKSFNAKIEADLDASIAKVSVIPQDIGRVLLNLINNAFYTVAEKKQQLDGSFEPFVSVSTRKLGDKVEVKVKDNGNGIPQKVMEKIFQPFFTTKPTGQGTGLGLSLSYDIITKGHGGELKVETKEGEGSEFIIQLPVT